MWNRHSLKRQGKAAFKRNYWKSVLTALLLLVVLGGSSVAVKSGKTFTEANNASITSETTGNESDSSVPDGWKYKDDYQGSSDQSDNGYFNGYSGGNFGDYGQQQMPQQQIPQQAPSRSGFSFRFSSGNIGILALICGGILLLIGIAVALGIRFFVLNPLEIGARRFFLMNLKTEPAEVKEIGYAFDNSWKNVAHTMFFRDLYLLLWSLLFIIPGIIKSYEYRMIPYLLAENPEMTKAEAFAESRVMMQGQKMKTFILDLSFLGWQILSAITAGIVGVFYVNPYVYSTNAALYAHLRYDYRRVYQDAYYTRAGKEEQTNSEYTVPEGEEKQTNPEYTVSEGEEKQADPEYIVPAIGKSGENVPENNPESAAEE